MSTLKQQVSEFHIAFDHFTRGTPGLPPEAVIRLRLRLIAEEFVELMQAAGMTPGWETVEEAMRDWDEGTADLKPIVDLPALADAMADLDYVIEGARQAFGINGAPIADAVHRANMAKLGEDGRPMKRADGKTMKPAGWQPPDIAGELRKQGWKG